MILRGHVFSKILQMETGITIVAPNDYKKDENYRVVYLLHGICGRSGDWVDYTMLPTYAYEHDVIFIMPEVARSFYKDMKYGFEYFTYLTEELPEICESVFNISSKREDTAVIGNSMGGYGALKCALSKPERYAYCCAFSSACLDLRDYLDTMRAERDTDEFKAMYGEQMIRDFSAAFGENLEWLPEDEILELANKVEVKDKKPKIYSACGSKDYMRGYNQNFSKAMEKLDLDFTYEEWEGQHDWDFFNEALKKAMKVIFE